jgi:hypothetical protein
MGASEQIRENRYRCVSHLARLRMLAQDLAGAPANTRVVDETAQAANAIMAEASAGCHAALAPAAGSGRGAGSRSLLQPRLARLQAAADDTVAAASRGDAVALRRNVRRFESLTSAIWAVLFSAAAPPRRRPRSSQHAVAAVADTRPTLLRLRLSGDGRSRRWLALPRFPLVHVKAREASRDQSRKAPAGGNQAQ